MRDLPLLLISAVVSAASTGHFALARMVTSAPATLVSASIGPVFFREAVLHRDTAHLNRLATLLLRDGAIATAPVFAGLMIWGDVLFTTVFGATWAEAGRIAMMLAPAAWWAVQSSWPERLFEVHARQGISLVLQLSADAVTALVFLAMLMGGAEPLTAIVGLAICQLVYHHTYVFTVFRISGFTLDVIARCMGAGWMVFFAFAVPALLLRILFPGSDTAAVIALSSAGAVSVALGLRVFRALSVIQATDAEEPSFQRT